MFRSHILQNQAANAIQTNPYNGDILIGHHIEANYVSDNSDSITAMEQKFETMVRWRSEMIVQWIDRFEAPITELEVARDGMAAYTEEELVYLWKQTFADNISGEEIQVISTHMSRYVDAHSLKEVQHYLGGEFDTQLSLAFSPVVTLPTSALCKKIATVSSASSCFKCSESLIMILHYYPPRKRIKNGKHLQLQQGINLTRND